MAQNKLGQLIYDIQAKLGSGFAVTIKKADASVQGLAKTMKGSDKGFDDMEKSAKELTKQFKSGLITFDQYEKSIKELADTKKAQRGFDDLTKSEKKLVQELDRGKISIEQFNQKMKQGSGGFGGFAKGLNVAKLAVAGFATALVAGIVRGVGQMVVSLDEARSSVASLTGATGDELDTLVGNVANVAKRVPQSFNEVGVAVGELNTRLGLTGARLDVAARQFLDFARVNDIEVSTAIRSVSRFMADAGIESSRTGEILDKLTLASQLSGISIERLSSISVQYGVQLRALGFDVDETIALLAKFEAEGVSTEKIFSGLTIALGRLASAGIDDTAQAFDLLTGKLEATESTGDAVREAIQILGQRAGPDFALAVTEGRFAIEDWTEALAGSEGTLRATAQESLTMKENLNILKNQIVDIIQPINNAIVALSTMFERMRRARNEMDQFAGVSQQLKEENAALSEEMRNVAAGTSEFTAEQVSAAQEALNLRQRTERLRIEQTLLNQSMDESQQVSNGAIRQLRELSSEYDFLQGRHGVTRGTARKLNEQLSLVSDQLGENQLSLAGTVETLEPFNELLIRSGETAAETQARLDAMGDSGEPVAGGIDKVSDGLGRLSEQIDRTKEKLEGDLANSLTKFGEQFANAITDGDTKAVDLVIKAEEKIEELRERLRNSDGGDNGGIRDQLKEQEAILESRAGFEERNAERILEVRTRLEEAGIDAQKAGLDGVLERKTIEEQIEEQRAFAQLNEFEKFEQLQTDKLIRLTDDLIAEKLLIEQKIQQQTFLEQGLTDFLTQTNEQRKNSITNLANSGVADYERMATSLRRLIALQRQAGAGGGSSRSSRGFMLGGHTGSKGGVVHANEYVIPAPMVSKMPDLVNALEGMRTGKSTNNNITMNNNVSNNVDFDTIGERLLFMMRRF